VTSGAVGSFEDGDVVPSFHKLVCTREPGNASPGDYDSFGAFRLAADG